MGKKMLEALITGALPIIVFVGGGWLMLQISGRGHVAKPPATVDPTALKPIGRRLTYNLDDAKKYWKSLGSDGLHAEQRLLQLDLAFPLFMGAALAFSLVMAWDSLSRPFNLAWLLLPVLLAVLADWAENLAQLNQIKSYLTSGEEGLQERLIRIASTATMLKWVFYFGSSLMLLVLIGMRFARPPRSS